MSRYGFVIHHNGPAVGFDADDPHTRCTSFWNGVRRYHMETKGWSDIAYSFGMCPHGITFTGRGWDRAQFANGADVVGPEDGSDAHWYTVLVFLGWSDVNGKAVDEEPSRAMVEGVKNLIAEGRRSGRCDDRVLPHNAFKIKRCPGATFTALAGAWDRKPLTTPTIPAQEDVMDAAQEKKLDRALDYLESLVPNPTRSVIVRGDDVGKVVTAGTTGSKPAAELWRWTLGLVQRDPIAIAGSIPDDLAEQVVDILTERLSG